MPQLSEHQLLKSNSLVLRFVYDRGASSTVENNEQGAGPDEEEQVKLPELAKGEALKLKEILQGQHFTQPPPRFNEASMIKTLEELGIGRPSTYSATVATIVDRKYVEKQGKTLIPTALGKQVNLLLVEHFGSIVDVGFHCTNGARPRSYRRR